MTEVILGRYLLEKVTLGLLNITLQTALKSVHHSFAPKFMLDYDIKCNH